MSIYIRDINIKTFRGLRDLTINGLGDINIITGNNNSGKTSFLEVLRSLESPFKLSHWMTATSRSDISGLSMYEKIDMLFNVDSKDKIVEYFITNSINEKINFKITAEEQMIELSRYEMGKIDKFSLYYLEEDDDYIDLEGINLNERRKEKTEEVRKLKLKFLQNDEVINKAELYEFQRRLRRDDKINENTIIDNIIYVSPVDHANGRLYLSDIFDQPDLYEEMLKVLKVFDNEIISINSDKSNNRFNPSTVYKILSKKYNSAVPLTFFGDGIKKAVLLISAVISAKNGVLLLDEFETAIHTSSMDEIFEWIMQTCMKLNVQVFMTSHSKEAIDKVLKCSENIDGEVKQITLYSNENQSTARILDRDTAIKLKDKLGVELR